MANTTVSLSMWFSNFTKLQVDIFTNCLIAFLSPLLAFLSLFSDSFNADKAQKFVESGVRAAAGVPSTVLHEGSSLLKKVAKKVAMGILAAVYVYVILIVILAVSFILGVGLVQRWVEQPVSLREDLHFDYTQDHPAAAIAFGGDYGGYKDHLRQWPLTSSKVRGVPIGHTFYVSVLLLLPDSDYNREIGVFQLTAEIISSNGEVMENASHPCMLQYRTWPIRTIRTFIMGLPLLLGISRETQTIEVAMLKHKEGFPRSAAVRIILSPRAGTDFLPQLYEAEILLNSQLRWWKEQIRRWKWTFCVWTSMSIYAILLLLVLLFFRPVILPEFFSGVSDEREQDMAIRASEITEAAKHREKSGVLKSTRRLPRSRSRGKRKATHLQMDEFQIAEPAEESCATSMTLTRDGSTVASTSLKEESGDSESACSMPPLKLEMQ